MVANGITRARLPASNEVVCTLDCARHRRSRRALGTTRSAAALDLWRDRLDGALVAIGNAPTALFRLLELIDQGAPKPAAIIGMPVGFVGAAESKEALAGHGGAPFLIVKGRKGGSAMAVAAVNALASEASDERARHTLWRRRRPRRSRADVAEGRAHSEDRRR